MRHKKQRDEKKPGHTFGTTDSNDVDVIALFCVCVLFDDVQANPMRRADDEHDFSLFLLFVWMFLTLLIEIRVTGEKED